MITTLNAYQAEAARTLTQQEQKDALTAHALGLGGEAGEYIELVKKHVYHGAELDVEKAKKELGDVLWYIAATCTDLGITLQDVARANIEKLQIRYPDGFSAEASAARVDVKRRAKVGDPVRIVGEDVGHCGRHRGRTGLLVEDDIGDVELPFRVSFGDDDGGGWFPEVEIEVLG
jgi:NTP pyrophosphatase (non-canonical NTP hydrolase)